jgi:hypothetical protein
MNRIVNWFRQRRLEDDLDRELQYHIDRRVTDLIHSGLPEPEAKRRVALELGSETQLREEVRDIWLNRWLRVSCTTCVSRRDLLFGARRLRRRQYLPGAQLVGEVVQYKNAYRLCYIRGPEGILIGLAQELS